MKKAIIAIFLCATALHAQDHLKNFRNKTAKQIANVSHLLRMDTTFFHVRIGEKGRDLAAAIEGRGLTPSDFATIKAALDTSIFRQNRLIFPPGTFTVDSLGIYSPITLSGVGIKRIKPNDTTYYGSMIKSTNTTGLSLLKVLESGVFLHDLSLEGTGTNGHGFYSQRKPVSGSVNTTLGGYGLARVNSFNHGGSGFYIVGSDGNIFDELESFDNRGYGVVVTSPEEAGLVNAGVTAAGTTSLFRGGRSRRNKLGGWLIDNQAAVGLHHIEAIQDTTVGVWFKNGRSRSYMLAGDVEMQTPALVDSPATYGVRVEDMNGFLMAQSFIGTQHSFGSFTADAGTNTTTIVDAALVNYGPDDYFVGSDVVNSTRSSGEVKITDYVASTGTLTLSSAIASQTTGDTYSISKDQNVGLRLKNLKSGVFINNTFGSTVDTMIATVGDGGALFINNINFDPEDNLKEISGNFKWLYINTADVDSLSGGVNTILMKSSNDFIIQSLDSLLLRSTGSTKGIEIEATQGKVAIQPNAEGGVHFFGQVGDDENPDVRIFYDADTTAGVTSAKYFDFGGSITQPNIFNIQNVDSTQTLSFGTPVRFSGSTSERYFDIQHHSTGTHGGTPPNGFLRFWTRGDTAFVTDDNGTERSLYAAGGGDVVGPASSTDNAVARFDGTTGKLIQNTSTLTLSDAGAFSFADGVTQTFNPNGTSAGLNVGSQAGDPSTPANGDLWYDGTANELTARINGANVALGAGGGSGISTATARANTGWTATGSAGGVAQDTLATRYYLDAPAMRFAVKGSDNDSLLIHPIANRMLSVKIDGTTEVAYIDTSGVFNASTITEATNAVPNATDNLGFFAATTSAQLSGVLSDETGSGVSVFGTSPTITTSISQDGDAADAGYLRLQNAANIAWESSPAGTDVTLGVDASEIIQASSTLNATALTEANNAVPNATDHLGFFAATTSSQLAGVLSDESGSGAAIFGTSPSLTTPSISGSVAMASGSAFSFNAGDVTVTHSADALTVVGGDIVVPTEVYDATGWNGDNSVPTKDAVRDKIETLGSSSDMTTTFKIEEDWVSGSANTSGAMGKDWQRTIATSGTTTHQAGESGRPGIMRFFCANSAGSTAALHTDVSSIVVNSAYVLTASVRFSSLGTAGSNGAYYRVGFMDDVGATIPTDGAWIEFNVDSSATRWRAVTGNGGTRTITTDGVLTVATGTWYKLTITPNSGATSIVFAVDGTTIATHTTNIPTGGVGVAMVAAAVTASSTKYLEQDYIQVLNTGLSR